MERTFAHLLPSVRGRSPDAIDLTEGRARATSLAEFAVLSAIDQARFDVMARQDGLQLAATLGDVHRTSIPLYANINRGIAPRTEAGFAAHARRAVADGFTAIKIAPFDGVELYGDEQRNVDSVLLDAGIARIAAVRDAIGPDVALKVDCHWRLNRRAARAVLDATDALRLHWLECPLPEAVETLAALRELRALANRRGVRLAGCEQMSLVAGFAPFLDAGAYDVMMPDVKYVGGMREMLDVADSLRRAGVAFSPHNPSGPIAHAASLHVCACVPHVDRLEMQYAETAWFDDLAGGTLPRPRAGVVEVPTGPGLGVRLDASRLLQLADRA